MGTTGTSLHDLFCKIGLSSKYNPIGVDIGDDTLKLVQLEDNGKGVNLIAGGSENRPENIKAGSGNWQRWAIEAVKRLTENGKFRGKNVIAAMPASEVYIEHLRMPKVKEKEDVMDVILSKIKHKLPIEPDKIMAKYIPTEEDNVLVIATERERINRHLAIYESANLEIKSICVWPTALANSYVSFFGRRKTDIEAIVMLLDIGSNYTNVVICRHKNLLFARSIPIGAKKLDNEETVARLVLETTACRQYFNSVHRKARVERIIFLSGQSVDKNVYTTIAKQLDMPAQLGDCLAAVEISDPYKAGIDRRECQFSWATAFGLSLS